MDATTDFYIVARYYSIGFVDKANMMLALIVVNLFIQLVVVAAQYKKKRWTIKVQEVIITLSCLRPIVDAYRVSMNKFDGELTFDPLSVLAINKVRVFY